MFISIINSIQKKQTNFSSTLVNKKIKDTAFFQQAPLSNTKISCCVSVNFVSNNIYCTFWSISGKRTFRMRSAGMKNFKPSKRRLLFYGKACIESFFKELQQ
jgi:hypothetical protein